jgi:hypothetical protein
VSSWKSRSAAFVTFSSIGWLRSGSTLPAPPWTTMTGLQFFAKAFSLLLLHAGNGCEFKRTAWIRAKWINPWLSPSIAG